ncbi:DUF2934 domain-containing protein [Paraburkholderia sp.]|uniref:DUF2934 domain-containing protein n=1 Tax=Paraburkholderia sp. TaxID=1926495 RepID=UPI00239FF7FD|nr:DUF2934 domain-containing protein [Paraburkholderia sp.]MDE1184229.1 DUF2934 domain-containing protein [Paraburkholderia sp.]
MADADNRNTTDDDLDARIRTRAYQLWQDEASPDGKAEEHWENARRQIEAEGGASTDAAPAADQSAERVRADEPLDDASLQQLQDAAQAEGQRQNQSQSSGGASR